MSLVMVEIALSVPSNLAVNLDCLLASSFKDLMTTTGMYPSFFNTTDTLNPNLFYPQQVPILHSLMSILNICPPHLTHLSL